MPGELQLRETTPADVAIFFEHQLDPVANHMAAFTSGDPADRGAFVERWMRILGDDAIRKRTVLVDGRVAGHVVCFERFGKPEITYWLGREHWGRGIATGALSAFLQQIETRPLYARAAKDNVASVRVLEKCGFESCGCEEAFAHGRGESVEEVILELSARVTQTP